MKPNLQPPPEPQMTRRQALLKLGFFQAIDAIYLANFAALFVIMGVRGCFFSATQMEVLIWIASALAVGQIWLITLSFRIAWFVLSAQADINLLPEAAARIVLGYQQKQ